jgi:hypothetical protein
MVLSIKKLKLCTLDPEPEDIWKKREEVDTAVPVNAKVPVNQECPLKCFGWEDKECLEDFWENTESLRRLTSTNIISSTSPARVISSRIKLSWLSIFTNLRPKKLEPQNFKNNKKLEDKRIRKRDKSKSKIRKPVEISNEHEYYIKAIIQLIKFLIFSNPSW